MTTNDLIGYDPLAWMDGEVIEEEVPHSPAKKVTKSKAKTKVASVETDQEAVTVAVEEENPAAELSVVEEENVVEPMAEADDDSVEMDVTIHEDGDIEIAIEADENAHVSVQISIDAPQSDDEIIDAIVDEVREEISEETSPTPVEAEEPAAIEEVAKAPEEKIEPLIELGAEATIKNIAKLYNTIKHALEVHNTIEINASDVTTIDTATLQLLVSLKKDAPCLNKTIDIIYPSARFIESAKLLDLLSILDVTES